MSLTGGSLVAAFAQGAMVGALVEGLSFTNGQYSGGTFGWVSAFSVICGVGLCFGYGLLGACWLVRKCDREVRDKSMDHREVEVLLYATADRHGRRDRPNIRGTGNREAAAA